MKLQLALDRLTRNECFRIVNETKQSIDVIEVGTGMVKEYGMSLVREMKERYPEKILVADMKTCDAGKHEARQAFEAGADITTVMAFSSDITITDTLEVARKMGKRIMIDLLEVSFRDRVAELHELGVDLISLHIGKDKQRTKSFNTTLFSLVNGFDFDVTVAGGISMKTLPYLIEKEPDTIIIGSAITNAENPGEVAAGLMNMIKSTK
ncbi:3-hexulose-6-phosphate synthase [Virgibacillus halotolerans]|uniref:3-hexulose-6-phosphate synthase n=1 Tax=Virgibacillus halotolerans TaxID=1071053 RepID=UPI0019601516|nr:3-hexulose-6-phosphate synthase [Virgibacillus halotolerans]MBM7599381.1 3-hexulose-6-phosphate synthase [Virgibacillus halotolerans]